jgi:hypothetical protein
MKFQILLNLNQLFAGSLSGPVKEKMWFGEYLILLRALKSNFSLYGIINEV